MAREESQPLRIRGGRVVDPSQNLDAIRDVWIVGGRVASLGEPPVTPVPVEFDELDAAGKIVTPGLIDLHVHLREPGYEIDETIEHGALAALRGGFTGIAAQPDTEPPVDSQASAEFVALQAKRARRTWVWPIGTLTKRRAGEELSEIAGLLKGGAVAFSDAGPITNPEILRRGLEYTRMFGRVVMTHPEVPELCQDGVMNEGLVSLSLGLAGLPALAEEIQVERDLALARWTGGSLHVQTVTCGGAVASIRRARQAGVDVTTEVTPHHLTLTEEQLRSFDSNFKVRPPLRTAADVAALKEGLADGTIDCICSDHSPWASESKLRELDLAPFGVVGMETVLPLCIVTLVEPGVLSWIDLIRKLSTNPARVLRIDRGSLAVGKVADVTVFDPDAEWTIDAKQFASLGRNTPFQGWRARGRVHQTLVAGGIRYDAGRVEWTDGQSPVPTSP